LLQAPHFPAALAAAQLGNARNYLKGIFHDLCKPPDDDGAAELSETSRKMLALRDDVLGAVEPARSRRH